MKRDPLVHRCPDTAPAWDPARSVSVALGMALAVVLVLVMAHAHAGPGAHGPNGEHLDTPAVSALAPQRPRVVAQSEMFELVAELEEDHLSIILDQHDSNEPVLRASVEVESGTRKAVAVFQPDTGDYRVSDGTLLTLLKQPGEHALVFTVMAGAQSDLLDGILVNPGASSAGAIDPHHPPGWMGLSRSARVWAAGGALLLLITATLLWWRARRRGSSSIAGMLGFMAPLLLWLSLLGAGSQPAVAGPGAHGPNGEHLDAPGVIPGSALQRLPDGSVNVPKISQRRMAIRTRLAPASEAAVAIELPGRVVIDPNAGGRVQALHGGRLEAGPQGLPVVGQRVSKGQVLAYVRHHAEPFALGAQQAQLADLQALRKLAQQRVSRLEMLEGTVPRKDLDTAREEAASLLERENRIRQSLNSREALISPIDGVVAHTEAVLGQVLESREVAFEVVDPNRVMVEATTADPALAGAVTSASLLGVDGVQLRLVGAARVLREGVLPLIFSAQATSNLKVLPLAVGQPVRVLAQTRQRITGIVLPAQAVVRNPSNEAIVWIKAGPERYIPQPIQFRALDSRTVIVTQGLSADNRVVVQGAPLIAQIR